MIDKILTTAKKEIKDHSRDRRALVSVLVGAIVGPIMVFFMVNFLAKQVDEEKDINLAVSGAELAPNLIRYLEQRNVVISRVDRPDDIPVLEGVDGLLVIPENAPQKFEDFEPVQFTLFRDATEREADAAVERVERMIRGFASQVAQARLAARGVSAGLASPIVIDSHNVGEASRATAAFSSMIFYFLLMVPFMACMAVAVDVTAGERERQSLGTLLALPVQPIQLMLGKWLAVVLFGVIGVLFSLTFTVILLGQAPLATLGIQFHLDFMTGLTMLLHMLPMVAAVAALQMVVALAAKSFKEAQTYISFLIFIPILAMVPPMLTGNEYEGFMTYLPVINQSEGLKDALTLGAFDPVIWLVGLVMSLAIAGVGCWYGGQRLGSEAILAQA